MTCMCVGGGSTAVLDALYGWRLWCPRLPRVLLATVRSITSGKCSFSVNSSRPASNFRCNCLPKTSLEHKTTPTPILVCIAYIHARPDVYRSFKSNQNRWRRYETPATRKLCSTLGDSCRRTVDGHTHTLRGKTKGISPIDYNYCTDSRFNGLLFVGRKTPEHTQTLYCYCTCIDRPSIEPEQSQSLFSLLSNRSDHIRSVQHAV